MKREKKRERPEGGQLRWLEKKNAANARYMEKSRRNRQTEARATSLERERGGRGTTEFPPSRQSSSYIPIRGWHSLISHIITLVRGALRSLAELPQREKGWGRSRGWDDRTVAGVAGFSSARLCLWGTDLRPPWVLIHRSPPPPPPGGCSCPNGPGATPGARGRETTPGDATCSFVSRAVSRVVMACSRRAQFRPRDYYLMSNRESRRDCISLDALQILRTLRKRLFGPARLPGDTVLSIKRFIVPSVPRRFLSAHDDNE